MIIVFVLIGLCVLFIGCGYLLNEKNAKYYLTGYWDLSKEEQEKFDLKNFLNLFRKFHLFLGCSILVFGLILKFLAGKVIAGIFITAFPVLAYTWLFFTSKKYWKILKTNDNDQVRQ